MFNKCSKISILRFCKRYQSRLAKQNIGGISNKKLWNSPLGSVILPNKLQVVSQYLPTDMVNVGVFINNGSRYETPENNGVSHFLEHMIFKGTHRRSRIQLEIELENMGTSLNAYTSREHTVYYFKGFNKSFHQSIDVLSDILTNSIIDVHNIEQERYTILREKEEVEKNMEEVILDLAHEVCFQDNSLGMPILGSIENIESLQRNDLISIIDKRYTVDNMLVFGSGNFNHNYFADSILHNFSNVKQTTCNKNDVTNIKPNFSSGYFIQKHVADDSTYAAICIEGLSWEDPMSISLFVLQSILRTYTRHQYHLSPYIMKPNKIIKSSIDKFDSNNIDTFSVYNVSYKDTGLFLMYFVASDHVISDFIMETLFNFYELDQVITDDDVELAKKILLIDLMNNFDSTSNSFEDIGRQILINKTYTPLTSIIEKVHLVNKQDIQILIRRFCESKKSFVGVGEFRSLHDTSNIKNILNL